MALELLNSQLTFSVCGFGAQLVVELLLILWKDFHQTSLIKNVGKNGGKDNFSVMKTNEN